MQEALLQEVIPNTSDRRGKIQVLVSMFVGFGVAMALWRPITFLNSNQEAASTLVVTPPSGVRTISVGTLPHLPSQQRPPLAAFRQNALPRMVARMSAEEDLQLKLLDALKEAKECKGEECLVMWDDVEELSAAVAHSGKKSAKTGADMTKEEMEQFNTIISDMKKEREALPKKEAFDQEITTAKLDAIAAAANKLEKIVVKYSEDEMSQIEAKIIEAITTAEKTKSAVDWEVVEELMAQKSHLKKFGGST